MSKGTFSHNAVHILSMLVRSWSLWLRHREQCLSINILIIWNGQPDLILSSLRFCNVHLYASVIEFVHIHVANMVISQMANSVDPDETARYEPSHLDQNCFRKLFFFFFFGLPC